MVKVKNTPAPAAAPQLAEPAPEHTYGWNVMSNCTSADVVLEHESKLDSFELFVARTPEGVWVGGGRATYKTGGYGCDASLKNPGFPTFAEAAQWAAGRLLLLDKAEKLTPNARRKLEALAALLPVPVPVEQEVDLPWLDCDGAVLLEGDKATVLPDVSKRLSGKLVQVLGDYDPKSKSVQVEPVGWEGDPFGILLCYLKRLPVLGENLEESDLLTLDNSAKPEVLLTWEAGDVLERIRKEGHLGALQPPKVTAAVIELFEVGLIRLRQEDGAAVLTEAGVQWLADYDAIELPPSPVDEALNAHAVGLRVLPLASIVVTRNTRKVFDEAALAELASSIQAHGVLQPIVVRPAAEAGHYELVAGERRYRAALAAGLTEIPATVRTLTDREFLEVQLLENLQRVDVRPADEAQAFAELLKNGYSAEEIGLKVGKGEKFVLQRAKLAELTPFWLDLLANERLPLVAAHELARLPADSQRLVAKEAGDAWEFRQGKPLAPDWVRSTINSKVLRKLDQVAWQLDDATLYPAAGPCITCPKRSGACRGLFDDLQSESKVDTCLDANCFAKKKELFVQRRRVELAGTDTPTLSGLNWESKGAAIGYRYYEIAKPNEKGAVQALVVDGADAGRTRWVKIKQAAAEAQNTKAEREAAIRKNRLGRMKNELWASKLRDTFVEELNNPRAPQGDAAAQALLDHWLRRSFTFGRTRTPNDLLSYLVQHYGWQEPAGADLDNSWVSQGQNGHDKYISRQLAPMSALDKVGLFFDLKIRDGLEQSEVLAGQSTLVRALPKNYQRAFDIAEEAEQAVEARYYTRKGKKQEASA